MVLIVNSRVRALSSIPSAEMVLYKEAGDVIHVCSAHTQSVCVELVWELTEFLFQKAAPTRGAVVAELRKETGAPQSFNDYSTEFQGTILLGDNFFYLLCFAKSLISGLEHIPRNKGELLTWDYCIRKSSKYKELKWWGRIRKKNRCIQKRLLFLLPTSTGVFCSVCPQAQV